MATPRRVSSRTTGRVSSRDLDQFASLIRTPSTPSSSSRRRQIPLVTSGGRTPRGPITPHAQRALQDHRARARTPRKKDVRKSAKFERETPIDVLRNLGRKLAPITMPISSSSPSSSPSSPWRRSTSASPIAASKNASTREQSGPAAEDSIFGFAAGPELERPRLSLSLEEMGITESEDLISPEDIQPPPRLSLVGSVTDEEEYDEPDLDVTTRSIEMPRERVRRERLSTFPRISIGADAFEGLENGDDRGRGRDGFDAGEMPNEVLEGEQTGIGFEREETDNLDRFRLDFQFPTPEVTMVEAQANEGFNNAGDNDDTFRLQPLPDDYANEGLGSPASSIAGGGSIQLMDYDDGDDKERREVHDSITPDSPPPDSLPTNKPRNKRLSKYGLPVPKVPSSIVKKTATRLAKGSRLSKETVAALNQATDWFFEQLSDDLATYSRHAGRKMIDESDVITLLRRQRVVDKSTSVFSLAQRNLPMELIQDLRLVRSKKK
ncbi:hypothetical protein KEM54_000955 [Ascosphaera aggregata]|nr:hypothetical protein KEM54_000955 [Ascosphaera aggregata]